MTGGRLTLRFGDSGEIVQASASADLDSVYEDLFNAAVTELQGQVDPANLPSEH